MGIEICDVAHEDDAEVILRRFISITRRCMQMSVITGHQYSDIHKSCIEFVVEMEISVDDNIELIAYMTALYSTGINDITLGGWAYDDISLDDFKRDIYQSMTTIISLLRLLKSMPTLY